MKDLEIFDKDGKALHIVDVIARFLKEESKDLKIRHDGIKVGIEYAHVLKTERLYITRENGDRMNSYELNEL